MVPVTSGFRTTLGPTTLERIGEHRTSNYKVVVPLLILHFTTLETYVVSCHPRQKKIHKNLSCRCVQFFTTVKKQIKMASQRRVLRNI